MPETGKKYSTSHNKGFLGLKTIRELNRDPIVHLMKNASRGDIVSFNVMGQLMIQINHPDLIRHVLMDNHKNYRKTKVYIRFEPIIGKGLFTSDGEKWKRDRQKIQPMFKREQLEGYYFTVISEVAEKYKHRWIAFAENSDSPVDLTKEAVAMTVEIIVKLACGKDNLDDDMIQAIHQGYDVFTEYLKPLRTFPKIDMRKVFHRPEYIEFNRQYIKLSGIFKGLIEQHKRGELSDKLNMLALLLAAQKEDPTHFSDQDILDQIFSMIFGGFETTSALIQWIYYVLDERPDIEKKMREEIIRHAPCVLNTDSSGLTYDAIEKMEYIGAVLKETMRLYPPIWVSSREPIDDDYFGDFKVKRGTTILLSQITMHRHSRWWEKPNAFIPERFLPENERHIDEGIYFPFSHGSRKCIGYRLAEMEGKIIIAKLLPFFNVTLLNAWNNGSNPSITLKPKSPLKMTISRAQTGA